MIIDRDTLKAAEPHIRALARVLKAERREIVEALEAHASIEQAPHQVVERQVSRLPPGLAGGLFRPRPRPKEDPHRSELYRRWVASLPCVHCGIEGYSNACHSDSDGKGMGIKASDQTCWPGCVDRPGVVGCHTTIGATGQLGRDERRKLERIYAEVTRDLARETGAWPKEWD